MVGRRCSAASGLGRAATRPYLLSRCAGNNAFHEGYYEVEHNGRTVKLYALCIHADAENPVGRASSRAGFATPKQRDGGSSAASPHLRPLQKPGWLLYGEAMRAETAKIKSSKSGRDHESFARSTYHTACRDKGYAGTLEDWYYVLRLRLQWERDGAR